MNACLSASEAARPHVLLVDDDPFMLKLLERMLAAQGVAEVECFSDGDRALAAIAPERAAGSPLLVICDLNMPGMDGVEFIRHLAERSFSGALALLSGEDARLLRAAEALVRAHHLRVLGTLAKPVSPENLRRVLEAWQGPRGAQGRARPEVAALEPAELRSALDEDKLELHYQPKVALTGGALAGVEALVRLRHPRDGLIYPDRFIALAESQGLIGEITRRVVRLTIAQAARWHREGRLLGVSVNITMNDLASVDFADFVIEAARGAGVAPGQLTLEITESTAMALPERVLDVLTRLRLHRVGLSIDDFGTGFSSLRQLDDLPFTELKIDQGFVHGAHREPSRRAIVEASAQLARRLRLDSVAEGVEDEGDWNGVREAGIDLAQGYFIGRPMPAAQLPVWLADWELRCPRCVQARRTTAPCKRPAKGR